MTPDAAAGHIAGERDGLVARVRTGGRSPPVAKSPSESAVLNCAVVPGDAHDARLIARSPCSCHCSCQNGYR